MIETVTCADCEKTISLKIDAGLAIDMDDVLVEMGWWYDPDLRAWICPNCN